MDHVVYVDAKAQELDRLLRGEKTMLIRAATGRKLPHGRVHAGDVLYLINNNGDGLVRARATVSAAYHSPLLPPEESAAQVDAHQAQLQLTEAQRQRWAGKRYLVLITLGPVEALEPFAIDRSAYGNMDDWLPVGAIESVRVK